MCVCVYRLGKVTDDDALRRDAMDALKRKEKRNGTETVSGRKVFICMYIYLSIFYLYIYVFRRKVTDDGAPRRNDVDALKKKKKETEQRQSVAGRCLYICISIYLSISISISIYQWRQGHQ